MGNGSKSGKLDRVLAFASRGFGLAKLYPLSFYEGLRQGDRFESVETFCLFVGYPRSGHSLIGALLDAHPNMIIGQELDVLKLVFARFSRRQIYALLLANSRAAARAGRTIGGYSYEVPGQWQGRFTTIKVIGDKKGGSSTLRLRANPGLLDRLRRTIRSQIKFIHVTRNPYDNITTIAKRNRMPLGVSVDLYFSHCDTIRQLKARVGPSDMFDIRHESFIEDPQGILRQLGQFLGVDSPDDYLADCAGIVAKSPHQSRFEAPWDRRLIEIVKTEMDRFSFLRGYSYDA